MTPGKRFLSSVAFWLLFWTAVAVLWLPGLLVLPVAAAVIALVTW